MKKTRFVIAAVCTVLLALNAFAVTYYISPTGSDGNDGQSPGAAFGTFLHATEALVDSDTLVVMEGVYTNPVNREITDAMVYVGIKTNDTLLTGITFKGEGPHKTVFHYVDGIGMGVTDIRHLRLHGTNNLLTGIKLDGDILGDAWWYAVIYAYKATACTISNMWIEFPTNITGRIGISPTWGVDCNDLLVTHCLVDGGGTGVRDFNWDDLHHTTFRNCTLVNQREGGADRGMGIIIEGNDGDLIEYCVMQDCAHSAVSLWAPETGASTTTVRNCIWYNCTDGFLDERANTYGVLSGIINTNPNLQTDANGLPYCSPLYYADYGWKFVPEPTLAVGLALAGLALIRRK